MTKTVLITGASRGIGYQTALYLSKTGYNLVLHCNKNIKKIEELKEKIKNIVCDVNPETLEFTTNLRQQNCLEQAKTSLLIALDGAERGELQDLISIDVKSALLALDEITGEVITDDILNNIFDNFCIGK